MKSLVEFVSNWYLYGSMTSTVDIWGDAEKQLSARVFVYDILNKKEVYSSESFSTAASASKKISNPTGADGNIYISTATNPYNKKGI